eukprot:2563169-Prymnesium_polylepis.1
MTTHCRLGAEVTPAVRSVCANADVMRRVMQHIADSWVAERIVRALCGERAAGTLLDELRQQEEEGRFDAGEPSDGANVGTEACEVLLHGEAASAVGLAPTLQAHLAARVQLACEVK